MNTIIIGQYGPNSALVGGLAMLPEEARTMLQELTGKIFLARSRYYRIKSAYLFGGDYGQVVAQCIRWYAPSSSQQCVPFVHDWAPPLQG